MNSEQSAPTDQDPEVPAKPTTAADSLVQEVQVPESTDESQPSQAPPSTEDSQSNSGRAAENPPAATTPSDSAPTTEQLPADTQVETDAAPQSVDAAAVETNVADVGASSPTTETPAADSSTSTSSGSEESPADQTAGAAAASDETAARPRVRLNPTVDPAQIKAIPSPSLSSPTAGPPAEQQAASTRDAAAAEAEMTSAVDALQAESAAAAPSSPAAPVELPPANEELDSDIEAQLAAAMAGEQAAPSPESAPAAEESVSEEELEAGTKLKGRVQSIQKENILLDVGFRASAMVSLRQFEGRKQPQLGQELEIVVDRYDADDGLLLASLPRAARSAGNWDEVAVDQVVECLVKKSNKGGLEVSVSNLRGFMPASQVDLGFVSSLDEYVGQKLTAKVIEVKPEKRNLVVSRRAYLQDEREEIAKDLWQALEVGQTRTGKVKTIKDYGAFVDIGGIDGLLHVAELSWTRVNHPRDILKDGQELDVQIISIDLDKKKISLSLKQLSKDPWEECVDRYPVESVVRGKVSNIANFGAFVEIETGVEGLIHISELDYRRINKVTDVLSPGEEVEAKVVSIDPERKRIGLSIKALKAKPEPEKKPQDEDLAPSGGETYQRKRKGPLKGGTGDSTGPLFG